MNIENTSFCSHVDKKESLCERQTLTSSNFQLCMKQFFFQDCDLGNLTKHLALFSATQTPEIKIMLGTRVLVEMALIINCHKMSKSEVTNKCFAESLSAIESF